MKKFSSLLISIVLLSFELLAQVPGNFNYQAVLRDDAGELITDQSVDIRISIIDNEPTGSALYQETHTKTTSFYGVVNLVIGDGTVESGTFSQINWGENDKYLGIEVDAGSGYVDLGVVKLLSVPYANYSNISDSSRVSGIAYSANSANSAIYADSSGVSAVAHTANSANSALYANEADMAKVLGSDAIYSPSVDTLFVVKDHDGNVVFAVFPDGAEVIVNETAKGKVGGFAVSGRNPSKATDVPIFTITSDSTRIYVNDTVNTKGKVGGFAVSGRNPSKNISTELLFITADSTRIYVNDDQTGKGKVGGFAVSGRNPSKGTVNDYLQVTKDSTRVYIMDSDSKGKVGGFAVSGRNPSKGTLTSYMQVSPDSTRIFVKDSVAGFSIANIESGTTESFLNLNKQNYLIGHQTGENTTGAYNSMIGYQAGYANTSGSNNLFLGYQSGYSNLGGGNNVYVGTESGYSTQNTFQNTFVGYRSGYSLTTASNSAYGSMAGENAAGSNNTFIGTSAGRSATGGNNTFVGNGAGYSISSNTGTRNTYIGQAVGSFTTTGSYNTMLGYRAGYLNYGGSNNTFLGYYAGYDIHEGSGNVFIGYEAGKDEDGTSNRLIIDNSNTTDPLIWGEFDNNRVVINGNSGDNPSGYTFYVNGRGGGDYSWNSLSDYRLKNNILDIKNAIDIIIGLRGVYYEWKDQNSLIRSRQIGFIAQETINVLPEVVDDSGDYYTMQYGPISAVLVEAIKEQQSIIEDLEQKNIELEERLKKLEELLLK